MVATNAMPEGIQNSERDGNFTNMNHEQIVATYSDITLEGMIRDLAKITHYGPTHYGPTRDWADKRLAAARAELRKREIEYNKILK